MDGWVFVLLHRWSEWMDGCLCCYIGGVSGWMAGWMYGCDRYGDIFSENDVLMV